MDILLQRFTYEFVTNPDTKAFTVSVYEIIESVKVLDDLTIKINFKTVNPA